MYLLKNAPSNGLLCPRERYHEDKAEKVTIRDEIHHKISNSFQVSDDEKSNQLHSLSCRYHEKKRLSCYICLKDINGKTSYYYCNHCKGEIHKECVESPSILHTSDHPRHPLQLIGRLEFGWNRCYSCREESGILFYYCSTCDFIIHPVCAKNPSPPTIYNPKKHEHTLQYFPRKSAFGCDFCGLEGEIGYLYVCLLCDKFFHEECFYLPDVIHLSRHVHPLATIHDIPYKEWTCQICYRKIIRNEGYRIYSCDRCDYAIHSRCVIQRYERSREQLQREIEEEYGDTKMFKVKDDGNILHLSHPNHQMGLGKQIQRVYDETKYCQACIRPIYKGDRVYQCMQCDDFILHESCTYLPLVIMFKLHGHPLFLESENTTTGFKCRKCGRYSCGFRYMCIFPECHWELDIHCASIDEPVQHWFHEHSLFMKPMLNRRCSICLGDAHQPLICGECDFILCFHCATLPYEVSYEHDNHLLSLSNKKDAKFEVYWCEICEEDIYPEIILYACDKCRTTLHSECLLGRDPYMKPGTCIRIFEETILALSNTHSTRPICKECKRRCPYKIKMESSGKDIFCSTKCCKIYLSNK